MNVEDVACDDRQGRRFPKSLKVDLAHSGLASPSFSVNFSLNVLDST